MATAPNSLSAGEIDSAMAPVPVEARMARGPMMMAWWAVGSGLFYFVVAAALAQGFGAKNAIIGLVLSVITFSIINGILARYAIRTGLSVGLLSGIMFGRKGANIATLILFLTTMYYAVFEGSVIAVGIAETFGGISYAMAALIVVLYSIPLTLGSVQNWLGKFNAVLFPVFVVGLVAAVVLAIAEFGYSNAWLEMGPEGGAPKDGWWSCFVYFMGIWILFMAAFDFARFGRKEDSDFHAHVTFGIPFYGATLIINGLIGIFLVGTVPMEGPLSEVSVLLALLKLMGIWGLVFVWVTQTRINTVNFQLCITNMESFFGWLFGLKLHKWVWSIVSGIAVFLLMLADVFSVLLQALAYQGIFVVAWVAIALTHILSGQYERMFPGTIEWRQSALPDLNPAGLVAWFASVIVGTGLYLFGGTLSSFSAPATAVFAAALYAMMFSVAKREWYSTGSGGGASGDMMAAD